MSEDPLAIGAGLVIVGIFANLLHPILLELANVSVRGWGWLLILIGVVIIAVRLFSMTS